MDPLLRILRMVEEARQKGRAGHGGEKGPTVHAHNVMWWDARDYSRAMRAYLGITAHNSDPEFDQQAFAFGDPGTESGHSLDTQDTDRTVAVDGGGDYQFFLRFLIEQTLVNADQNLTTTFKLQARRTPDGGSPGSYFDVTASSSFVRVVDDSNIADGAATTQRMTGGGGVFLAGEYDEGDGTFDSITWDPGTNNAEQTELLSSLEIVDADMGAGDVLDFRIVESDGTVLDVYTVADATLTWNAGITDSEITDDASVRVALAGDVAVAGSIRIEIPAVDWVPSVDRSFEQILLTEDELRYVHGIRYVTATIISAGEVTAAASVRVALAGEVSDTASIRVALAGDVTSSASIRAALAGEVAGTASVRVALAGDTQAVGSIRVEAAATDGEVTAAASIRVALAGQVTDAASVRVALAGTVTDDASVRVALAGGLSDAASVRVALAGESTSAGSVRIEAPIIWVPAVDRRYEPLLLAEDEFRHLHRTTYVVADLSGLPGETTAAASVRVALAGQTSSAGSIRIATETVWVPRIVRPALDLILSEDPDLGLYESFRYAVTGDATLSGEITDDASVRVALAGNVQDAASVRIAVAGEVTAAASLRAALAGDVADAASVRVALAGQTTDAASARIALAGDLTADASVRISTGVTLGEITADASVRVALNGQVTADASTRVAHAGTITDGASLRAALAGEVEDTASVRVALAGETIATGSVRAAPAGHVTAAASTRIELITPTGEVTSTASVRVLVAGTGTAAGSTRVSAFGEAVADGSARVALQAQLTVLASLRAARAGDVTAAGSMRILGQQLEIAARNALGADTTVRYLGADTTPRYLGED